MGPTRRLTVAGLVLAIAAGCGPAGETTPAGSHAAQRPASFSRASLAAAVIQRQATALAEHDRRGFLADWLDAPAARRTASDVYANLVALGVAVTASRLVSSPTSADAATWSVTVDISWGLAGMHASPSSAALLYRFAGHDGRAQLTRIESAADARLPVWLLPGLEVRRTPRTLVAAGDVATAERLSRLLRSAVAAVGSVLPGWQGSLLAFAPATPRGFAALIGATARDYAGIAAVTTTVDGSDSPSAPVVIVVDPAVFDPLGPVSAAVVVTHEATHAATGAATADMPLWVAEGFADYVGVGAVAVPTQVAARAALRLVRRQGAPAELPSDPAFAVGRPSLEASYEQAWLAATLIAKRHGRIALVAFYQEVAAHPRAIDAAFSSVLHTSRSAFTTSWRRYLERLARGR